MKKLLSVLASLSVTGVAAISVVSCSVPTTTINVDFTDENGKSLVTKDDKGNNIYKIGDNNYSISDLSKAMSNSANIANASLNGGMSFNALHRVLLEEISFNPSLVVKTQKDYKELRDFRNLFLGRDQSKVDENNYKDIATVDGIYFDGVDGSEEDYYKSFVNTKINSLSGLQNLSNYKGTDLNESLKEQQTDAINLFAEGTKASEFMKEFTNSKKNPAFTDVNYELTNGLKFTEYNTKSQVVSGISTNKGTEDDSITLGKSMNYADNNKGISVDESNKNLAGLDQSNPYGAVILGNDGLNISSDSLTKDKDKTEIIVNDKDSNNVFFNKDWNDKYMEFKLANEYVYKPVNGLKISYTYNTNVTGKNTHSGTDFKIKFDVNNLVEAFKPIFTGINGNVVKNIKISDDNKTAAITFTKKIDDKIRVNTVAPVKKINDTTITVNADNNGTYKISGSTSDNQLPEDGLTYQITKDNKNADFATGQISWIFSGYKFVSPENLEKVANGENNNVEVTHHLRDLSLSGWTID